MYRKDFAEFDVTNKSLGSLLIILLMAGLAFGGCVRQRVELPVLPKEEPTTRVTVYSPSSDGLIGEDRYIPTKDYQPRKLLQELISKKGVKYTRPFKPFLPPGTKILSLKVDKGLATVNFSREVLNVKGSETMQRYAVAAIVETLKQFKSIEMVKFQVEGREKGKIDGRNIEDWWGEVTLKEQPWK